MQSLHEINGLIAVGLVGNILCGRTSGYPYEKEERKEFREIFEHKCNSYTATVIIIITITIINKNNSVLLKLRV